MLTARSIQEARQPHAPSGGGPSLGVSTLGFGAPGESQMMADSTLLGLGERKTRVLDWSRTLCGIGGSLCVVSRCLFLLASFGLVVLLSEGLGFFGVG